MNLLEKLFGNNKKQVYLDHAAATPIDSEVLSLVSKMTEEVFGNPGSLHSGGERAKQVLNESRGKIAKLLHAGTDEVIFTRGGTEACNIMVQGFLKLLPVGSLVLVNPLEHPATLEPLLKAASEKRIALLELPLNEEGIVTSEAVKKMLVEYPETKLVVCQYANSEIGTINPISEIGRVILSHRKRVETGFNPSSAPETKTDLSPSLRSQPYFICDAIQAINYCNMNILQLHVDALTISGSKIYGPRSSSCLFIKRGISIEPILFGGGQERGVRAGTEDVALSASLASALEKVEQKKEEEKKRLREIQEFAFGYIQNEIPDVIINGAISEEERLPNNINISIPNCDSEYIILALDKEGFAVSSQSACSARSGTRSRIIKKLWEVQEKESSQIFADIRITMGRATTRENIKECIDQLVIARENWKKWNS